jgi:peroxiredoxin
MDVGGPGIGERIGHLSVLTDQGDPVTLSDLPGDKLVIVFFRGHW